MTRLFAGQPPVLWALAFFFLGLGFATRVDIPLIVLAVTAAMAIGDNNQRTLVATLRAHWPLLSFLLVAVLVTALSVDPRHSIKVQPQLVPALLCYVVIVSFVTDHKALEFVCLALLVSGLVTALSILAGTGLIPTTDPLAQVEILGNALLVVPNDALMLVIIVPLTLGMCWTAGWHIRLVMAIFFTLALLVCVMLQSRQAVVLLVLGPVIVVTLMQPRWCIPILAAGIAAGTLVDALMGWPLAQKIFMFPRAYVWHTAWVMFLDRPWTGQGPGMFKDLYYMFLEQAGYIRAELGDRRMMPWAHSLYLEQLAERGIFGLLALLCLMGTAMIRTYRAWRIDETESGKSIAAGGFAALVVMAATGIAEATLSRLWVTVMLLVLVAFAYATTSCLSGRCLVGSASKYQ